jgi:predicted transcriptional regulator of viral defense system
LHYSTIVVFLNDISRKDKPHLLGFIIKQSIMARSTYISENLTQNQISFMLKLDEYEMDIFNLKKLKQFETYQFEDINELVENLVHKKILSRIERGKYCRSNFRDEKVIGTHLVEDGAVAYWSALNLHGLTEQFPNSVFIQTTKVKPTKEVFGVNYQFVKIASFKRSGLTKEGFGNHSYCITDIEKTIVDCFDLPQYSGGYAELIRAFATAKLSGSKLIDYCKVNNNMAATKRMGYLAELFEKNGLKSFIRFAKEQAKDAYNPLDPHGPDSGSFIAEWRLKLNISKNELLDIANKQY